MTTMRAAFVQDGVLTLRHDYPVPVPHGGGAAAACGWPASAPPISNCCAATRAAFTACSAMSLSTVVTAPSAPHWEGRRVVGELNVGCGARAISAGAGWASTVANAPRAGHHRAMASLPTTPLLPVQNLHAVPDHVPDEIAVFTEPLAAAYELLEQIPFTPAQRVIIQGDGRLGLLCALVLAWRGCNLTVLGRHAKLTLLDGAGIHTQVRDACCAGAACRNASRRRGRGDGRHKRLCHRAELVRPGGVLALKSTFADHLDDFDLSRLVVDEISLVDSRCGPFSPALAALAAGHIDPRPFIHAEYSLDAVDQSARSPAARRACSKC